jgi:hypothetical protein
VASEYLLNLLFDILDKEEIEHKTKARDEDENFAGYCKGHPWYCDDPDSWLRFCCATAEAYLELLKKDGPEKDWQADLTLGGYLDLLRTYGPRTEYWQAQHHRFYFHWLCQMFGLRDPFPYEYPYLR